MRRLVDGYEYDEAAAVVARLLRPTGGAPVKSRAECRILIVDDVKANVDLLVELLRHDYKLSVAMNGESALAIARKTRPDLILLDVSMPGMDGYEVCRRLAADGETRGIPVILQTSLSDAEDEAKGLALGAVDYITKPFNPELLRARVRNHLELKRHRDEPRRPRGGADARAAADPDGDDREPGHAGRVPRPGDRRAHQADAGLREGPGPPPAAEPEIRAPCSPTSTSSCCASPPRSTTWANWACRTACSSSRAGSRTPSSR